VEHGVFGYSDAPPELTRLYLDRLRSVYGCGVEPSEAWLRWIPGLIGGLNYAVRATCRALQPSDTVVIPTPIYPPFLDAPRNCGATLRTVPLAQRAAAGEAELFFEVDWAALEAACADPATKLLHWCNPHNPVGRCWTREELARVAALCVREGVVLCSDEVWGEMPLEPAAAPFTSMLALLGGVEGLQERLIVLTSPSKCFNIAPLDVATAVIPGETLRRRFLQAGKDAAEVGPFGYVAALAAYGDDECEAWRERLVAYLTANRDYAAAMLSSMDGVRCVVPESSYLMWIDATDALPPDTNAEQFFLDAGVGLSGGLPFGAEAGTCRINSPAGARRYRRRWSGWRRRSRRRGSSGRAGGAHWGEAGAGVGGARGVTSAEAECRAWRGAALADGTETLGYPPWTRTPGMRVYVH